MQPLLAATAVGLLYYVIIVTSPAFCTCHSSRGQLPLLIYMTMFNFTAEVDVIHGNSVLHLAKSYDAGAPGFLLQSSKSGKMPVASIEQPIKPLRPLFSFLLS